MTGKTATRQLDAYGSQSVVMGDLRLRQEMALSNDAFVKALDRYFQARELWGQACQTR